MGLCIDLAIAKTNKYASRESGDTAEVAERPGGGVSVVVADGQGSGRSAKALSLLVTAKAIALLKDGVRDGAVARAVHDSLFAYRGGQVSATLDIASVDLRSGTLVVARNATAPLIILHDGAVRLIPPDAGPIGLYPLTRPHVTQLPLAAGLTVILVTDGIVGAGTRAGRPVLDLAGRVEGFLPDLGATAIADRLLADAVEQDDGKPADDMTVVALRIHPHEEGPLVRRLAVRVPLP